MPTAQLAKKHAFGAYDILGAIVEFLTPPDAAVYCVIKGTIPAGQVVPLHSHTDDETFYVHSGRVEVLSERGAKLEWQTVKAGDSIHIPADAKHAFRNSFSEPVVQLITTTPRLGRFFREVGKPFSPAMPQRAPTPEEIERFTRVAAEYRHWLANPEENAAVGISLL
jgi:quercetin dioxygenase-like cupin family protein